MGRFLGITVKRVARVGAWTSTLKTPMKCVWRREPDRRSNFFGPPALICAITNITEISLIVTLSKSTLQGMPPPATKSKITSTGVKEETYEMSMALGARPWVQLLKSAFTCMCRHYNYC